MTVTDLRYRFSKIEKVVRRGGIFEIMDGNQLFARVLPPPAADSPDNQKRVKPVKARRRNRS
jgi:antitoxin (DNA-binding transcriptional repressor) of toxin-antitoxin stability system